MRSSVRYASRCKTMHRRTSSGERCSLIIYPCLLHARGTLTRCKRHARNADAPPLPHTASSARTSAQLVARACNGTCRSRARCETRSARRAAGPSHAARCSWAPTAASTPHTTAAAERRKKNTRTTHRTTTQARLPLLVRVRERGPPRQARGPGVRCRPRRLPQAGPLLEGRLRDRH